MHILNRHGPVLFEWATVYGVVADHNHDEAKRHIARQNLDIEVRTQVLRDSPIEHQHTYLDAPSREEHALLESNDDLAAIDSVSDLLWIRENLVIVLGIHEIRCVTTRNLDEDEECGVNHLLRRKRQYCSPPRLSGFSESELTKVAVIT